MKPAGPGKGDAASVAVADLPPLVREPEPLFVYNPWKLKELRRLYINLEDGSNVGYPDLATMAEVPESGETARLPRRALPGLPLGIPPRRSGSSRWKRRRRLSGTP
ncbi:hypothetical protein [Arthrobacter humicola]